MCGLTDAVSWVAGRQVLNRASVKSLRVAVKDWADRVCGRNELMQPEKPSALRSMAASKNSFTGTVVLGAPLVSRQTQPPQSLSPPFKTLLTAKESAASTVASLTCW